MTQLLAIESAFLNATAVTEALNLREFKKLNTGITNAQKKKYANTLALAKIVLNGFEWWSTTGQALANEEGITWSTEAFFNKAFGFGKSYSYKLIKAAKLSQDVLDRFDTACAEVEAQGKEADRSLAGLLKFSRTADETSESEGGEGEEGEGSGEGESVERATTIFTMTLKGFEGGNVAVRIDSQGVVKTTNSREEIEQAVAFLMASLEAE